MTAAEFGCSGSMICRRTAEGQGAGVSLGRLQGKSKVVLAQRSLQGFTAKIRTDMQKILSLFLLFEGGSLKGNGDVQQVSYSGLI